MIVTTVLYGALAFLLVVFIKQVYQFKQWRRLTAQTTMLDSWHPIWGHLHLINDVSDYIRLVTDKIQTSKTKLTSAWMMFFYPVFTTCHPDTAKVLFKSSEPKSKYSLGGPYRMLLPWLGKATESM